MAFFDAGQLAQDLLFVVLAEFVQNVEKLNELGVHPALKTVGVELEVPFFCLAENFNQRKKLVFLRVGHNKEAGC